MGFETKRIASEPDAIAPDGSEVRVLCQLSRGGLATFSLPPNAVSKAVAHRTVEEVWYIVSGKGRMWRKLDEQEEIAELGPGISLTIPTGAHFQFRCNGPEPLNAIGATMPPWPGENEAFFVDGAWQPTVLSDRRSKSSIIRCRSKRETCPSQSCEILGNAGYQPAPPFFLLDPKG